MYIRYFATDILFCAKWHSAKSGFLKKIMYICYFATDILFCARRHIIPSTEEMIERKKAGASGSDPVFPGDISDYQKNLAQMIRGGFGEMSRKLPGFKPRSTWNEDVYAGCVERLADFFVWDDWHAGCNGAELETRVRDWNEALNNYCDDKKITGKAREKVVKDHLASPFAACGNVGGCAAVETTLKEFARCGGCKKISYCSPNCQKAHWKQHKSACRAGHPVLDVGRGFVIERQINNKLLVCVGRKLRESMMASAAILAILGSKPPAQARVQPELYLTQPNKRNTRTTSAPLMAH